MSDVKTNMGIWHFFNNAKVVAVHTLAFNEKQRIALKQECDNLFKQATGNSCCPAWFIGGF